MTDGEETTARGGSTHALADGHAFMVGVERRGSAVVLTPRGELDCDTAPEFEGVFTSALRPQNRAQRPERIVVDCVGLAFCDSSGLNALLRVRQRAGELGADVRLAVVPGIVTRLLDVTGITAVLPCHPSVADALAADGDAAPPQADVKPA